jgi:hypothetical protein
LIFPAIQVYGGCYRTGLLVLPHGLAHIIAIHRVIAGNALKICFHF